MNNNLKFDIDIIIDKYSNYVFKIVNNMVNTSLSYQDKEEIVSDSFYLLWKNQDKIKDDIKSYLAAITKNCIYKKFKNNKIDYELKDLNDFVDFNNDDSIIINEAIENLKIEEKELFELYYVKGFKIKEIAQIKHISSSSIKMRLLRLRKKIKEVLLYGKN